MTPLTERQRMLLDGIIDYLREHDGYPSFREMMDMLEVSSTNAIQAHLQALQRKGRVALAPYESRSLRVLADSDGNPWPTRRELEAEVQRLRALVSP